MADMTGRRIAVLAIAGVEKVELMRPVGRCGGPGRKRSWCR